jgi:tellurite resistance protein TerC
MEFSLAFWLGFLVFVLVALAIDMGVLHRRPRALSFKEASNLTAIWVLLASIFCTFIYFVSNEQKALEFFTAYVVELTLSMDNVFVFLLIFKYFKIPLENQHRVLFWGVLGAIVMRFIMIIGGIYLVQYFEWLFIVFGVFLIVAGIKLLITKSEQQEVNLDKNSVMKFLKRFFNVTNELHGDRFIVRLNGVKYFTPLFVALILIEKTDLVFALDSIPAVLAISRDPFIVFTSNIFAILGLRSLYFLLANLMHRFIYLKHGISIILVFVGLKMILAEIGFKLAVSYSLLFIMFVLLGSIGYSLLSTKNNRT